MRNGKRIRAVPSRFRTVRDHLANYPLIAGILFWIGAVGQIAKIIRLESAYAVSAGQWSLYACILFGYCWFYYEYLKPGRARFLGILASAVSGALYVIIVILTFVYK